MIIILHSFIGEVLRFHAAWTISFKSFANASHISKETEDRGVDKFKIKRVFPSQTKFFGSIFSVLKVAICSFTCICVCICICGMHTCVCLHMCGYVCMCSCACTNMFVYAYRGQRLILSVFLSQLLWCTLGQGLSLEQRSFICLVWLGRFLCQFPISIFFQAINVNRKL